MIPCENRPGRMFGRWRRPHLLQIVSVVFIFGVLMIGLNIYQLRVMHSTHLALHGVAEVEGSLDPWNMSPRPKVWVAGKRLDSGYLKHVFATFSRIGYQRNNGGLDGVEWDVLWTHDYPFGKTLGPYLTNLKPHQRVNHYPGSGYVTNKVSLATSDIKHIPKAFKIPKDKDAFLEYSKEHPDQLWVQKSNNHRGVKIKGLDDLDLVSDNTFIQEYVDKPYLIDGHRFDIGLYTALTSIDPLRVYVFNNEWLIRFCPDEYYPFEPTNINKYVITDEYKPPWEIPKMAKYYTDEDTTRKQAFMQVLEEEGFDGKKLETELFETIVSVFLNKEHYFIKAAQSYPSSRHFFEMVRFDFVFDDKLNVYLMEVNMSPNLSSGHFAGNKLMYEQVVYGLLNLVGVASPVTMHYDQANDDEANMQVSSRQLHVYPKQCASDICKDNCGPQLCKLCKSCLRGEDEVNLKAAYREHANRHGFQRVFPRTFSSQKEAEDWEYDDDSFSSLNPTNKWMTLWFRGKCIEDQRWCI